MDYMEKKPFFQYTFPQDKSRIRRLSLDEKMQWYSNRIEKSSAVGQVPMELMTPEFAKFWKWNMLVPIRMKRFLFRLKNGEIFKKYQHISEFKRERQKNHAPSRI